MKLIIKESAKKDIQDKVTQLDMKMGEIARAMQEKIPVEVAQEYFLVYSVGDRVSARDVKQSHQIGGMAQNGMVRLADIFLMADYHNNIRED